MSKVVLTLGETPLRVFDDLKSAEAYFENELGEGAKEAANIWYPVKEA